MNSEQERSVAKISYEKPTAVDLGPAAPVMGASCAPGDQIALGGCSVAGNGAGKCSGTGNSATGGYCQTGPGFA